MRKSLSEEGLPQFEQRKVVVAEEGRPFTFREAQFLTLKMV